MDSSGLDSSPVCNSDRVSLHKNIFKGENMNWRQPIIKCGTKLLRSKIPDILSEIPSWEYASRPKLDAMVNEKLWNLLVHTWSRVPYYYNLVSEQPIGAFNQIPPLTRDMINNIPNQLLSCDRDQRGYFANSSGGSSGHPIRFFQDKIRKLFNSYA